MMLPDLVLPERANQRWLYSGMDQYALCLDKKHFENYPHHVEYVFNSRGLRDHEWPLSQEDLGQAIWCVGDSFTVGVGQPFHHTWPQVLQDQTATRTINVSMDGASNQWILRRALDILRAVNPRYLVVMWSYTHRREDPDTRLDDENRRWYENFDCCEKDWQLWLEQQSHLASFGSNIVQIAIPDFAGYNQPALKVLPRCWNDIKDHSWPSCPTSLQDLLDLPWHIRKDMQDVHRCWQWFHETLVAMQSHGDSVSVCIRSDDEMCLLPQGVTYIHERLDRARDGHHFDILTAKWVVQQIVDQMAT